MLASFSTDACKSTISAHCKSQSRHRHALISGFRTICFFRGPRQTMKMHECNQTLAITQRTPKHPGLQKLPARLLGQPRPRRGHTKCRTQAAVKTPSTKEPLRAPGSESNFKGSPARREDIPITSPTSPDKQMQVSRAIATQHLYSSNFL